VQKKNEKPLALSTPATRNPQLSLKNNFHPPQSEDHKKRMHHDDASFLLSKHFKIT